MRILIVDDDQAVLDALDDSLKTEWPDAEVECAGTAAAALHGFASFEPDLVLLDIGLPGENGYEILRRIRRLSDVPIVLITGRGIEMDEVRGLQLGADDYVAKPFSHSLLVARIKALLRRAGRPARDHSVPDRVVGDLAIDFRTHEVTLRGDRVRLTPVEYKLLYHLARSPGRLIPHRKLLQLVWGDDGSDLGRLHVYVKRLRDKIEDAAAALVENERGLGYRFVRPSSNGAQHPALVESIS
jgi:DNA-binding response OmpR family regulator